MACISLLWLRDLLIWLVVVGGIVLILRLIVPEILSWFEVPAGATVWRVINIVCGILVAVALIYLIFSLIQCVIGGAGLPTLPLRR